MTFEPKTEVHLWEKGLLLAVTFGESYTALLYLHLDSSTRIPLGDLVCCDDVLYHLGKALTPDGEAIVVYKEESPRKLWVVVLVGEEKLALTPVYRKSLQAA